MAPLASGALSTHLAPRGLSIPLATRAPGPIGPLATVQSLTWGWSPQLPWGPRVAPSRGGWAAPSCSCGPTWWSCTPPAGGTEPAVTHAAEWMNEWIDQCKSEGKEGVHIISYLQMGEEGFYRNSIYYKEHPPLLTLMNEWMNQLNEWINPNAWMNQLIIIVWNRKKGEEN